VNRHLARPLVALIATLAVLTAACSSTPAKPALTDPKEILTQAVVSLKDVKTFEFTASFAGNMTAGQLGNLDLSTMKLSGAVDAGAKKASISFDAPTLFGTKFEARLVGNAAYYKVAGMLATMLPGSADKFTKVDGLTATDTPASDATDIAKVSADLKAGLDKLPTPPTKAADEKCGDQDCYHVTLAISPSDLPGVPTAGVVSGNIVLDVLSRKSDYRPARLTMKVASPTAGEVTMTFDLRYDVSVNVEAPPADQVVTK
jgi:hypothetical protein